eukprot:TRINITY_DN10487_c0_g2_i1.p1 TRINITY_DN10487_c0_g2~~TRINITY_DN10487_c0_g2_i1.p1  ORF type:complete len:300 (+),score=65.99 TRINITY_DN10487_c0_g2_i1:145-1044(+)
MGSDETALALVSGRVPRSEHRRVMKYPGVFKRLCKRASENDALMHSLDLRGFQLGEDGAFDLAQSLRANSNIRELNLWINHIGDDGVVALAEVLQRNSSITRVDLFNNDIGDAGAAALADTLLRNSSISFLGLHTNQIGGAGASALAAALSENTTLVSLVLEGNSIDDMGFSALADALENNTTLTELNLQTNSATDPGLLERIDALLERNQAALQQQQQSIKEAAIDEYMANDIHSLTQTQDLSMLADCVGANGIAHTGEMLDLVDKTTSRCDKTPAIAHVRSPVRSERAVCDVENRIM